jgi:DNA sulfur modification protein DndC
MNQASTTTDATGTGNALTFGGASLDSLIAEIRELYLSDGRPWVVGYSGGKDSTAVLRLVYEALLGLAQERRHKPVFVVCSDTLVETPVVVGLISETLRKVQMAGLEAGLPVTTAMVTPDTRQTFWVNLLGKGYPAPTRQFRWCTDRMKIDPVSEFITSKVAKYGEVICVLGSRLSESSSRAQVMKRHKIEGKRLAKHSTLPSAFVYTPIERWSADDVWEYLFSSDAPWGGNHQALFDLYKDSNAGECPLVIDTSTPSCGNSRFGCWVCTVVTKDKAIDGLIESGHQWLVPLQDFRNELYRTTLPENKTQYRNFRRRTGKIQLVNTNAADTTQATHIPGPYWLDYRRQLLRKLLEMHRTVNQSRVDVELITKEELQEIRRLWRQDPNEPDWEDSLPRIYFEVMGEDLDSSTDVGAFSKLDAQILHDLERKHGVPAAMLMKLIELELSQDGLSKRSTIFERIDQILNQDWGSYEKILGRKRETQHRDEALHGEERTLLSIQTELEELRGDAA